MKNAIPAIGILFILYLHILIVPPRNLRGDYYKYQPRDERTCYSNYCTNATDGCDGGRTIGQMASSICRGVCVTSLTTKLGDKDDVLFSARGCAAYCEPWCSEIFPEQETCFECCDSDMCNA